MSERQFLLFQAKTFRDMLEADPCHPYCHSLRARIGEIERRVETMQHVDLMDCADRFLVGLHPRYNNRNEIHIEAVYEDDSPGKARFWEVHWFHRMYALAKPDSDDPEHRFVSSRWAPKESIWYECIYAAVDAYNQWVAGGKFR